MVAQAPFVLIVNPALPVKSVVELIDFAKKRPAPLSYGSGGPGAPHHLYAELISAQEGDVSFDRLPSHVAAPRDSGRAARPATWRRALAWLGTISTDAQYNQSSAYSRVLGTPSFVYLFGFSSDPGTSPDGYGRVAPQFGNITAKGEDWRAGGRTRLVLPYGAFVSARSDFSHKLTYQNGVVSRSATQRFPSLEFEYGRVAHAIQLDRFLRNPQLRTSYDRARVVDKPRLVHGVGRLTIDVFLKDNHVAPTQPLMRVRYRYRVFPRAVHTAIDVNRTGI